MKIIISTNKTYMQQANYNRSRQRKVKYIYVDQQYYTGPESSTLEIMYIPTPLKIPVLKSLLRDHRINTIGRWKQKKKHNDK